MFALPTIARRNTGIPPGTVVLQIDAEDGSNGAKDCTDAAGNTITWYNASKVSTLLSTPAGSKCLDVSTNTAVIAVPIADAPGTEDMCLEYWWNARDHSASYECDHARSSGPSFLHAAGKNTGWALRIVFMGQTLISSSVNPFTETENVWRHMALTRQGTELKMYMNGVLYATGTCTLAYAFNPGTMYFGAYDNAPTTAEQGFAAFDMIRMTKGSIKYGGNFTPPTSF